MNDQRCGTCDYWGSFNTISIGDKLRGCSHPMSIHFENLMMNDDGTDCPCYERKEANEANSERTG